MEHFPESRRLIHKIVNSSTFEAGQVPGRRGASSGIYYHVYHLLVDLGRFQLTWMLYEAIVDLQDLLEKFHQENEGKPDGRKSVDTTRGSETMSSEELQALESRVQEANHPSEAHLQETHEIQLKYQARQKEARPQAALALQRREDIAKETVLRKLPPFLKLPAEIRNMIYELLLVVRNDGYSYYSVGKDAEIITDPLCFADDTRLTYHKRWRHECQLSFSRPSVALLRTCALIHKEALPILYGKNRFRLPTNVYLRKEHGPRPEFALAAAGTPWLVQPYSLSTLQEESIFKKYGSLFRHISIHFSLRKGGRGHIGYGVDCLTTASAEAISFAKAASCSLFAADLAKVRTRFTRDAWGEMGELLQSLTALKSVAFTFEEFYRKSWRKIAPAPEGVLWDNGYLLNFFLRCLEPFLAPRSPLNRPDVLTTIYIERDSLDRDTVDKIWDFLSSDEARKYLGRKLDKRNTEGFSEVQWAELTAEQNAEGEALARQRLRLSTLHLFGSGP